MQFMHTYIEKPRKTFAFKSIKKGINTDSQYFLRFSASPTILLNPSTPPPCVPLLQPLARPRPYALLLFLGRKQAPNTRIAKD